MNFIANLTEGVTSDSSSFSDASEYHGNKFPPGVAVHYCLKSQKGRTNLKPNSDNDIRSFLLCSINIAHKMEMFPQPGNNIAFSVPLNSGILCGT